ncbi:phasin family protein [Rubneribacter sp.]
MAHLGDGFKDIFLAGVGAMAITGEKTKELVDQLIAKGELTVDQGREINSELKHKAEEAVTAVRYDALEARMAAMTPKERTEFAAKAAEFAAKANAGAEDASDESGGEVSGADAPETGA